MLGRPGGTREYVRPEVGINQDCVSSAAGAQSCKGRWGEMQVHEILASLRRDHVNCGRLIGLVRQQLDLPDGAPPDWHLLARIMGLALAYFIADKFWLSKRVTETPSATAAASGAPPSATPAAAISDKSIAVLPFVDMRAKTSPSRRADFG